MYRHFLNIFLIGTVSLLIINGCGEGVVNLSESQYKPKIVIQGYIYPERKVEGVRVSRNYPISDAIRLSPADLVISDADVKIRDLQNDSVYPLSFHPLTLSYDDPGFSLQIGYGKSYRIDVRAVIDSVPLSAWAVTKTPEAGFRIRREESRLDSMIYRQKNGEALQFFYFRFNRSPSTDFYVLSYNALDADPTTFVYSPVNPFTNADTQEVIKNFRYFKNTTDFLLNVPMNAGVSEKQILWFNLWFYGRYRLIMYAADLNFKNYYLTYNDVQEFDGNFHEPKMNIQGNGIGVFGSAITDTVYFTVLPPG